MPFLKRTSQIDQSRPSIGHNNPPQSSGCCIMTENGWKQLSSVKQEIRQPSRVAPLKADGRFVSMINPEDYDDQGRLIRPKSDEVFFAEFRRLLDDAKTNSYRSGPGLDYFGNRRRPGHYDKWGVRVMV